MILQPSLFSRTVLSAAVIGAFAELAQPAMAQTTSVPVVAPKPAAPVKKEEKPEPPPAPATGIEASVTVTGNRPTNRIDRQVYDVQNDISTTNASAADALSNVPSVAVDPDGTVTLRGSTNVQILVDGKPSAMMQGDNRGATLNSMPAEDIESIEVINNPGAQFGNEGGGGPVLNIVMRRTRKPGGFGSVSANGGTAGRYNSSASGTYNTGRYSVQAGANVRHDGRNPSVESERVRIDPVTGARNRSTQSTRGDEMTDSTGFTSSLTYNLGDKDTLGASAVYSRRDNDTEAADRYISFDANDVAYRDYLRTTERSGNSTSYAVGAKLDHKGDTQGEIMKFDLRVSSATNEGDSTYANTYAIRPAGVLDRQYRLGRDTDTKIADFTGDYELPGESGTVKAGFKVAKNINTFDTRETDINPGTGAETLNAARSNEFELDEGNLALYGSYQMRLNENWGMLGGLRAEYTKMDVTQLTSAIESSNHYTSYIPSLFVTYKWSSETNLRLSYARRIRRPGANELNPFVVYRDEFNVFSGNPNLMPTKTDSFDLGYESKIGSMDTNLRAFYRKDSALISDRKVFISDTVLLTTFDNAGSNQSGGLEFRLDGKITPKLTLNTSGNVAYTERSVFSGATAATLTNEKRSATALTGRVRLNYHLSDTTQVSVNLNAQGKTLSGQGYRQPTQTANFTVRHMLTPALFLVLNVTDAFDSNKIENITDTDLLKDRTMRRYDGRIVYFGLSYRLGGVSGARGGQGGPGRRVMMRERER